MFSPPLLVFELDKSLLIWFCCGLRSVKSIIVVIVLRSKLVESKAMPHVHMDSLYNSISYHSLKTYSSNTNLLDIDVQIYPQN